MMKNQFGLKPKGLTFSYKRLYLEWYDLVTLPTNYRLPEFAKFTGQDSTSTIEHVSLYLTWNTGCIDEYGGSNKQ